MQGILRARLDQVRWLLQVSFVAQCSPSVLRGRLLKTPSNDPTTSNSTNTRRRSTSKVMSDRQALSKRGGIVHSKAMVWFTIVGPLPSNDTQTNSLLCRRIVTHIFGTGHRTLRVLRELKGSDNIATFP